MLIRNILLDQKLQTTISIVLLNWCYFSNCKSTSLYTDNLLCLLNVVVTQPVVTKMIVRGFGDSSSYRYTKLWWSLLFHCNISFCIAFVHQRTFIHQIYCNEFYEKQLLNLGHDSNAAKAEKYQYKTIYLYDVNQENLVMTVITVVSG